MVGAELSAPSRPAESGNAWPPGVRVMRRSAWRQKTFPESEALLGTASHERYLVVHFPRPAEGWTFAESTMSFGGAKYARGGPQNKDGDTTIAKTARYVAAYAIETFTGAAPPAQPDFSKARLFNARVYAVDTTNLSRLDRAVDAIPANDAAPLVDEPAPSSYTKQRRWETLAVPVRTRTQKQIADEQARLDAARSALDAGPARLEEARAAQDTSQAAYNAATDAHARAQHALEMARIAAERARSDLSYKKMTLANAASTIDSARAIALIARARIDALEENGRGTLPFDEIPDFWRNTMKTNLEVLACALRKNAASEDDRADAALAEAANRINAYAYVPSEYTAQSMMLSRSTGISAADIAWFNEAFSTSETRGPQYVRMLVLERLMQRFFARGHTLEELKACF